MKQPDPYYLTREWQDLRITVIRRDKWRCSDCGQLCRGAKHGEPRPVVDHIVMRKAGGSDAMHNLRLLCLPCHNKKTMLDDYNSREPIGVDGFPASWR